MRRARASSAATPRWRPRQGSSRKLGSRMPWQAASRGTTEYLEPQTSATGRAAWTSPRRSGLA
eukprot:8124968-Lingulodinium_polyedra.AAC.1